MTNTIKEALLNAGIPEETSVKMASNVVEIAGITEVDHLNLFTPAEMKGLLSVDGTTPVQVKLAMSALKKVSDEANAASSSIAIETIPEAFEVKEMDIAVTGNIQANMASIVRYINVINLYNLGIEDVASNLITLVEKQFSTLEVGATKEQLAIFQTMNKFKADDSSIYQKVMEKLNITAALVDSRKSIIELGNETFIPGVVEFVNEALDFRLDVSSVDHIVLRRVLDQKGPGNAVNVEDVRMAAQQFIQVVNKGTAGLNTLVIDETYALYSELYELLDSEELHKFLGVSSKEDLLRMCGVTITPKQARVFADLPQGIYGLLQAALSDDAKLSNPDYLYRYLQTAWETFKLLDLMQVAPKRARQSAGVAV